MPEKHAPVAKGEYRFFFSPRAEARAKPAAHRRHAPRGGDIVDVGVTFARGDVIGSHKAIAAQREDRFPA